MGESGEKRLPVSVDGGDHVLVSTWGSHAHEKDGFSEFCSGNGQYVEAQESVRFPQAIVCEAKDFEGEAVQEIVEVGYKDIAKQFSLLGWTAFGGPNASIAMFEKRLVEKLHWMRTDIFAELFSLSQCLPGPTATQVSFAIGIVKKGITGGVLSGILFQYPGAIITCCLGAFAAKQLENPRTTVSGMIAGVSAVGVAFVASAAKSMASKLCKGPLLASICTIATILAYKWPTAYTFPCVIICGGLTTLLCGACKKVPMSVVQKRNQSVRSHGVSMPLRGCLCTTWIAVLVASIVLVNVLDDIPEPSLVGSILQNWIDHFRSVAWLVLFSPGILLIFGVMPFWGHFRRWAAYRRALPGFNAACVGLIITSVFTLTFGALEQSDFPKTSLCLNILAFTAVDQLKWFEPLVVILGGVLGVCAYHWIDK